MATVTYFLPKGAKPTQEQLERLAELKNRTDEDIVCDEDCPETTEEHVEEMLYLMRKYNTRRITKEIKMKEFPERFQKRTTG
ncbi:MAG: hypothetical protein IKP64_10530 [Selenomonadaceae bacterium]|nr:hypothetical protein [Selenomonadaceae bacterium]MBR4383981.1 hypothetical protein [Selenomonadaceae bacterium]